MEFLGVALTSVEVEATKVVLIGNSDATRFCLDLYR